MNPFSIVRVKTDTIIYMEFWSDDNQGMITLRQTHDCSNEITLSDTSSYDAMYQQYQEIRDLIDENEWIEIHTSANDDGENIMEVLAG